MQYPWMVAGWLQLQNCARQGVGEDSGQRNKCMYFQNGQAKQSKDGTEDKDTKEKSMRARRERTKPSRNSAIAGSLWMARARRNTIHTSVYCNVICEQIFNINGHQTCCTCHPPAISTDPHPRWWTNLP